MFQTYFEDRQKGGLFHAVSEDWSRPVSTAKRAEEQFSAARGHVIGGMITHDPATISDAEQAVREVMGRFEDTRNGGFFREADEDWNITRREKSLHETGEIFGVLMHLYEISHNDDYLLRAMNFMDTILECAWDAENAGFYSLYTQDWGLAADTKDLATQCSMLQHLNGSWKDGMDSPYGARAAAHKKRAEEFGALLLEKAQDRRYGGFYTTFSGDWKPLRKEKDVGQLAELALTLYFHYHNNGPSIWGPRRASHAYTGRSYPPVYIYRGPAPSLDPVSMEAYAVGGHVIDVADLLIQNAWDAEQGGFFTCLSENLQIADDTKTIGTQLNCFLALNVAYRLSGFPRFQQKLAEAVKVLEEKSFDPENGGVYETYSRDWQPVSRDKPCGANLMVGGIMSMMAPVVDGVDVTRSELALWIDPPCREIPKNGQARFTVTVQNQGFEGMKVRVGGLTSPGRWMDPGDVKIELAAHQVYSYPLTITPPEDMPEGSYFFEITCLPDGPVGAYVSAGGKLVIH